MPTIKEYTDNYVRWSEMLRVNADRIIRSSETRKQIMRHASSAPLDELLKEAVDCIADLTGDTLFRDQVITSLERRAHDTHQN